MKKTAKILLLCVIFIMLAGVYASVSYCDPKIEAFAASENLKTQNIENQNRIEFFYKNRVFQYDLQKNIKKSSQFDLNYEINKYNRFEMSERKILLRELLSLGFDNFIIVNYLFPNLDDLVEKIEKNVYIAPKDARLKIDTNSEKVFFITPEIVGQKLNRNKLYDSIIENMLAGKPLKFNLPLDKLNPQIKASDYQKYSNLRADFSTNFSASSADRKHNIKNALTSLNKIEIQPGDVFSFNKTVGKRTKENGYREAKIIVNNEFVDGLGGGVCQVSTTLYNSALLAGLDIVEANKHSKQIGYVKYGFDAMVNFGSSDLKFKNNTSEKITIITNYLNDKARIRIFGEKPTYTYKLTNEIVSTTEPSEQVKVDKAGEYLDKVEFEDEFFYLKPGTKGMEVKSYREVYKENLLIKKELLRFDKFKPTPAIKIYGAKKRKENFFASMAFDLAEAL